MMEIAERFEDKYMPIPITGCWEWIAYRNHDGYGKMLVDGKSLSAHRVSYSLYKDDIPSGMCVCHACDNPSCVNPDHLFLGSHKDNMQDMYSKGRRVAATGSSSGNAKLNECDVSVIKKWLRIGISSSTIADEFHVERHAISNIASGKFWSHVKET